MKVLVVENNPIDYLIIAHALRDMADVVWCRYPWQAVSQAGNGFDCLVVDHDLPEYSGNELVSRLRDKGVYLPVIMISDVKESAVEAILFKDDFIVDPGILARRITEIAGE